MPSGPSSCRTTAASSSEASASGGPPRDAVGVGLPGAGVVAPGAVVVTPVETETGQTGVATAEPVAAERPTPKPSSASPASASASCSPCSATAPSTSPEPPPLPSPHERDQHPRNRQHGIDEGHRGTPPAPAARPPWGPHQKRTIDIPGRPSARRRARSAPDTFLRHPAAPGHQDEQALAGAGAAPAHRPGNTRQPHDAQLLAARSEQTGTRRLPACRRGAEIHPLAPAADAAFGAPPLPVARPDEAAFPRPGGRPAGVRRELPDGAGTGGELRRPQRGLSDPAARPSPSTSTSGSTPSPCTR